MKIINQVKEALEVKKELIENYDNNLFDYHNLYGIYDNTYNILVEMFLNKLSETKTKENPIVIILRNNDSEILLSMKIEYNKKEWLINILSHNDKIKENDKIIELNKNDEFMNSLVNSIITDVEDNEKLDILLKYLTRILLKDIKEHLSESINFHKDEATCVIFTNIIFYLDNKQDFSASLGYNINQLVRDIF